MSSSRADPAEQLVVCRSYNLEVLRMGNFATKGEGVRHSAYSGRVRQRKQFFGNVRRLASLTQLSCHWQCDLVQHFKSVVGMGFDIQF